MPHHQKILLTVDAVVLATDSENNKVLLIKRKNPPFQDHWAIPGGFVENEESIDAAAKRELQEETGLEVDNLQQLYAFGEPKRDPRSRVVSVAYWGIADPDAQKVVPATDAKDAKWFPVDDLPPLAFDHAIIIAKALEQIAL